MSDLAATDRVVTPEEAEPTGFLSWVASVDHKQVGIMYMLSALAFFGLGGLEALIIRLQLAMPGIHVVTPDMFNQLFSMHGTTMIFLVVMPVMTGMATYIIPLMVGARDVAFPRLNAMSFWVQLFGGVLLYFSFIAGGDGRGPAPGHAPGGPSRSRRGPSGGRWGWRRAAGASARPGAAWGPPGAGTAWPGGADAAGR